jgi:hypothetical protein
MGELYSVGIIPSNIVKGDFSFFKGRKQPTPYYQNNSYAYSGNISYETPPVAEITTCTNEELDIGNLYYDYQQNCAGK